jgi:hypothetical protein
VRMGASLVLIAIGAILKFAVTTSVSGVNLATVGVVLMAVGIVGLVLSIVLVSTARRTDVVHHSTRRNLADPTMGDDARY